MGTVAGLLLGAGLLLLWFACWPQPTRQRRTSRWRERTQDLLVRAGAPAVTPARLVVASVVLATLVLLLTFGFTASPPIAVCFGAIAAGVPSALVRARARRRQIELRSVWPEVVDDLISAIRAGMSLPEALTSLGERGPVEVRPEFQRFGEDYRVTGRFTESLDRLKARLADPVADRIVEALRITREVGGSDLVRLLRTLGQLLREDLRTRGELEARQSWTVNGARLATAAPWLVLLLLSGRPETAAAFNSAMGVFVLAGGAAVSGLAYWLMVRLGRLPEEARVLR
ncbi:type II secretion system F family protein [Georgenia sp. H159]|uniref:type II secretion system F family protein n=1 Tax=Georgenia sp. H159 TaxID=3076115 RepID=UPI002D78048E|nr:type II secretion system F family protein [Georgenia sp. H159]